MDGLAGRYVVRGRKVTPVGSPFLCVDDYGSEVYRCRWTETPVAIGEHRISGNIIPQANVCYVAKVGTERIERESRDAFHESEANCNMCIHFSRYPYEKEDFSISGLFSGRCKKHGEDKTIAPDDYMGMPCWMPR